MVEKPDQKRNRDIKKKRTSRNIGGSEKGCEWRLGAIYNKIKIGNPKLV